VKNISCPPLFPKEIGLLFLAWMIVEYVVYAIKGVIVLTLGIQKFL